MNLVALAAVTCAIYCGLIVLCFVAVIVLLRFQGVVGFVRPQSWRQTLGYVRLFALLWLISYAAAFALLARHHAVAISL